MPKPRELSAESILHDRHGNPRYEVAENGCWLWTGALDRDGYANRVKIGGVSIRPHREMCRLVNGDFSEPHVDHLCHDRDSCEGGATCTHRRCVNPEHLQPKSVKGNIERGHAGRNNASKTHCPAGHPYSGDNLTFKPNGGRRCRACHKAARDRYEAKGIRPPYKKKEKKR